MAETVTLVHRLPGRVRLRIAGKRGNTDYFKKLSQECGRLEMVSRVKANSDTGSLVVEFTDTIEHLLEQMQNFDLDIENAQTGNGIRMPLSSSEELPSLNLVTGRDINLMFMAGSVFAVLGIVQAARGNILAPSLTLLWYAVDAYRHSRRRRE